MLYPEEFLKELFKQHIQTKWARITILNWNEQPIQEIEGLVTGGSANIDGNSAIRTTISLQMLSKTEDLTKYTIALKSKVKIEIGLENRINDNYPNIIWFKQGIFIVTAFNTSKQADKSSLSISGKDKGCLLNGEISGSIPVTTDFGQVDEYANTYEPLSTFEYSPKKYYYKIEDKFYLDHSLAPRSGIQYYEKVSSVTTTKLPIKDIIRNIVHVYGHEPWHKIIVNDLDLKGTELLEYRGESPLYLIKKADTNNNVFVGMTFDGNFMLGGQKIGELSADQYYSLSAIDDEANLSITPLDGYYVVKIEYGDTMGYKGTELTFPGDLIGNVGENVVSVLDKIKNLFGNFEYFFDLDGNFIFQAKHTYENVNFSKINYDGDNEVYIDGSFYNNSVIYSFTDEELNTQISHTPNITNLKNDFSIWGERTTATGAKVPIHLRYAIEAKPYEYTTIGDGERSGITYVSKENSQYNADCQQYLADAFQALKDKNEKVANAESDLDKTAEHYAENVQIIKENIKKLNLSIIGDAFSFNVPDKLKEFIFKR